jgi:hypothetical protein
MVVDIFGSHSLRRPKRIDAAIAKDGKPPTLEGPRRVKGREAFQASHRRLLHSVVRIVSIAEQSSSVRRCPAQQRRKQLSVSLAIARSILHH